MAAWIKFGTTQINPESFEVPALERMCEAIVRDIDELQIALTSIKNEIYSRAKFGYDDMGTYLERE